MNHEQKSALIIFAIFAAVGAFLMLIFAPFMEFRDQTTSRATPPPASSSLLTTQTSR